MNFGDGADCRFAEVVLADCGSTVHVDSHYALEGEIIGAPIFRSPEAHLQLRWGTATDIWSFGTTASFYFLSLSLLLKHPHNRPLANVCPSTSSLAFSGAMAGTSLSPMVSRLESTAMSSR